MSTKNKGLMIVSLIVTMVLVTALSGCGGDSGKPAAGGPSAAPKFLRIGTASMGGNFFPLGSALSQLINDKVPGVKSSAQATGGSAENCNFLDQSEIEMALVQSETLTDAYKGQGSFKGRPITKIKGITSIYFNSFHVLVRKDSGINNITDIKGKRVAVGPIAGGIEINHNKILSVFGIAKTDYKPIYGTREEATEFLKTNRADVHIYATGKGSSQVTDMMGSGDIKLLSFKEDQLKKLLATYPDFGASTIPKTTYKNLDQDIHTVVGGSLLVTTDKMPEDLIYKVTKAIFENKKTLETSHKYFKETDPKTATQSMSVPLHPGAEKYLKEIGAIKK